MSTGFVKIELKSYQTKTPLNEVKSSGKRAFKKNF